MQGKNLDLYIFRMYHNSMDSTHSRPRGRPQKAADELRSESLLVRLDPAEKEAFKRAASVAGIPLSTWVRERLRRVATRELEGASIPIPFIRPI